VVDFTKCFRFLLQVKRESAWIVESIFATVTRGRAEKIVSVGASMRE
jgi:hypothetical protein